MLVLECTSMKTMRVNSEQRWFAYKETVAESLDKAFEFFATKKVDSSFAFGLEPELLAFGS